MSPRQARWQPSESARPIWEPVGTIVVAADAPIVDCLTSQFSGIQLQQPRQQSTHTNSQMSQNHPSEGEVAAVQFIDHVRSTVPSREEHYAFLQLMTDHKRRSTSSGGGDMNAIKLDTLLQVDELFRNYPLLIAGFRANFYSISALFGSILG